jgi:DNA adenine methylase
MVDPSDRAWLASHETETLLDAFAGGGSVSLTAAAEGLVKKVVMVELDPSIAVVWSTILTGDANGLVERIRGFIMLEENVLAELNSPRTFEVDLAFQTILRNRVQRGGIMAPGAGLMKAGEAGKGIGSRWYPETLSRRIEAIREIRERIELVHGDGLAEMRKRITQAETAFFIDPPYTASAKKAGSRLYGASMLDHEELFQLAGRHAGAVLMTYDNAPEVKALALKSGFAFKPIAMRSNHNTEMSELLVSRDFNWFV